MTIHIKKYKNRRLYDTEASKYITLEQLKYYVISGVDFCVEDSETGKDLTSPVLLQIIVEMEIGPSQFLSSVLLRQIICLANHPMQASLGKMMEQMLSTMESSLKNDPYQKATEAWNKQMSKAMQDWQNLFGIK